MRHGADTKADIERRRRRDEDQGRTPPGDDRLVGVPSRASSRSDLSLLQVGDRRRRAQGGDSILQRLDHKLRLRKVQRHNEGAISATRRVAGLAKGDIHLFDLRQAAVGGPAQVLKYLARYTHRIAISNRRLVAVNDRTVTLPLEGLRPRPPPAHDDARRGRVLAPLPPARGPVGLHAHSATSACWPTACAGRTCSVAGNSSTPNRRPRTRRPSPAAATPRTDTSAARSAASAG